jgi:tetratricopeptide (TPR) repeat protein
VSRTNRRLLLLVAVEIVLGAIIAGRRLARLAPPEPDWALLDPATATEIRTAAAGCESAEDWRKLGELYMAAGCFRESEMCHRVACKLAPDDATFARQWAFALERLALLDEANAQYRRTAELRREEAPATAYFVGRNFLRADKPQEARAAFAEGAALDANRYELARLHLRAGELAEAEGLLQGLTTTRPGALQVQLLGYRLAMERGDARLAYARADAARYAIEKLQNPFDEEAARIVKVTQLLGSARKWKEARDLIESGRLDQAENALQELSRTDPSPGTDELLAEVALRRGRFREAAAQFEGYESRNGPSPRIAARAGDAWDAAGQPDKARAGWLRATRLEAGANLKDAHHKLARSFAQAGDKIASERHLACGHYFVGRDLLQFGYVRQSVDYFAAAGRHDPNLTQGWFYLGEARRRSGQVKEAESAYRACLKLDPHHGRALAALAWLDGAGK